MKKMFVMMVLTLLVGLVGGVVPAAAQAPGDDAPTWSSPSGPESIDDGNAPPAEIEVPAAIALSITQSNSLTVGPATTLGCQQTGLGSTLNSYYRVFDLPDEFGINSQFTVSSVDIGVELSNAPSGSQSVTVNLHTLAGAFVVANLTPIGTTTINLPTGLALTTVNIPVTGVVPPGSTLVVEIFNPDGRPLGNFFYLGSNNLGQTGLSYIRAPDCGANEPTDTAALGFGFVHFVMVVNGDEIGPPINDLCASYYTGQVSIPHAVNGCPAGTLPMTVPGPQAKTFCIKPATGALRWFFSNSCGAGWIPHVNPTSGPLDVCAHNWTRLLRAIYGAQKCTAYETLRVIPDTI